MHTYNPYPPWLWGVYMLAYGTVPITGPSGYYPLACLNPRYEEASSYLDGGSTTTIANNDPHCDIR